MYSSYKGSQRSHFQLPSMVQIYGLCASPHTSSLWLPIACLITTIIACMTSYCLPTFKPFLQLVVNALSKKWCLHCRDAWVYGICRIIRNFEAQKRRHTLCIRRFRSSGAIGGSTCKGRRCLCCGQCWVSRKGEILEIKLVDLFLIEC